jgi:hypothetical protein
VDGGGGYGCGVIVLHLRWLSVGKSWGNRGNTERVGGGCYLEDVYVVGDIECRWKGETLECRMIRNSRRVMAVYNLYVKQKRRLIMLITPTKNGPMPISIRKPNAICTSRIAPWWQFFFDLESPARCCRMQRKSSINFD